jgi:hypothetical protein
LKSNRTVRGWKVFEAPGVEPVPGESDTRATIIHRPGTAPITMLQWNSFVADTHRSDGKRFIVRANEKLGTFVELESAICMASQS